MKTVKIILLSVLAVLVATVGILVYWFSLDKKAPDMELNSNVKIDYQQQITEDQLIDKLVKYVDDDKTEADNIKIHIKNYDEFNTDKIGKYKLYVIATDESDKSVLISEMVEVRKSDMQLLEEAKNDYKDQIKQMQENKLIDAAQSEQYLEEIDALTNNSYKDYQAIIDQYQEKNRQDMISKNQKMVKEVNEDIEKLEAMKYNASKYQKRLKNIDQKASDEAGVLNANKELSKLVSDLTKEVKKQKVLEKESFELAKNANEE